MDTVTLPGLALRNHLLRAHRSYLQLAGAFSAAINLLYLTPSIFMLQVYDRVVPTGGQTTLFLLGLVTLAGLGLLCFLDWLRARVLLKASAHIDALLSGPVLTAVLSRRALSRIERAQAMREIDALRAIVSGGQITTLLDLPWTPIFLIAAFLLHPWLGVFTLFCAVIIFVIAIVSERAVHHQLERTTTASAVAYGRQAQFTAFSSEIGALGMVRAMRTLALKDREAVERTSFKTGLSTTGYASLAKFIRIVAQSAAIAVSALLAINGSITAGVITVGTLILGRALQPIELLVGSWKGLVRAGSALAALEKIVATNDRRDHTQLPDPIGALSLEHVTVTTPQGDRVALSDVSFSVPAGEILSVVGLSGAGKSTLLRAIVGGTEVVRGTIRIDRAQLTDWEPERLGRLIGYLPQERVVFTGTVKDNISRFDTALGIDPTHLDAEVVRAATRAGAHDMILRLPEGYDTPLGNDGAGLSPGQAQRIALARACYGEPRIMVLDEPCANLDAEAKLALVDLIQANRRDRVTTILSSHDREVVGVGDKVLLLVGGRVARNEPISKTVAERPEQTERAPAGATGDGQAAKTPTRSPARGAAVADAATATQNQSEGLRKGPKA